MKFIKIKRSIISFVLSGLMLLLLWLWQSRGYNFAIEDFLFKPISLIKNTIIDRYVNQQSASDVLFVNAASNKMLVNSSLGVGNDAVVDRQYVDSLLKSLNRFKNKRRQIVCDLVFTESTAFDSSLSETIKQTDNLFFPTPFDASRDISLNKTILQSAITGSTAYNATNSWWKLTDEMLKFPLVNRTGEKSLPLKVFEHVTNDTARVKNGFIWLDNQPHFKTILIDENIRSFDFNVKNNVTPIYSIEDALINLNFVPDSSEFKSILDKDFIIIGNFETDVHKTVFGVTAGPFINYNIILSLFKKSNQVNIFFILFLWVCFTGMIHFILFTGSKHWLNRLSSSLREWFGSVGGEIFSNAICVWLISAIGYFLFSISLDIMVASLFLSIIAYVKSLIVTIKEKNGRKNFAWWFHLFLFGNH